MSEQYCKHGHSWYEIAKQRIGKVVIGLAMMLLLVELGWMAFDCYTYVCSFFTMCKWFTFCICCCSGWTIQSQIFLCTSIVKNSLSHVEEWCLFGIIDQRWNFADQNNVFAGVEWSVAMNFLHWLHTQLNHVSIYT